MINGDNDFPDKLEVITGNYLTTVDKNKGLTITRRNNYVLPALPLAAITYSIAHLKGFDRKSKFMGIAAWGAMSVFNSMVTMHQSKTAFSYGSVFNIKSL